MRPRPMTSNMGRDLTSIDVGCRWSWSDLTTSQGMARRSGQTVCVSVSHGMKLLETALRVRAGAKYVGEYEARSSKQINLIQMLDG